VSSGANVLILDEPTNHLDLESREALEDALRSFDGTVLLVSHDRALLDAVGTRTLAIEDGTVRSYAGGWADYVRARKDEERAPRAAGPKKERPRPPAGPSKNRQKAVASLERRIEAAEAALAQLEEELADPSAWASPSATERNSARHAEARAAVERLYEELETAGA
jgi:ATP-binding cassette subfamily F protein 3